MSDPVQVYFTIPRDGDPNNQPMSGNLYTANPVADALRRAKWLSDGWHLMRIPEVLRQIPNKPDTPHSPVTVGYGELITGVDTGRFYSRGTPIAVVSVGLGDRGSHGAMWEQSTNGPIQDFGEFLQNLESGSMDRSHFPKTHELMVQGSYPRIDAQTLQTNAGFRPYAIILPVEDLQRPVPYGPMKVKDIRAYRIVSALLGPHDIVEDFVARRSTVNSGKTSLETSIDITYDRILEPGRVYSVLYEPQQRALAPEQIGRLSIMEPFGGAGSVTAIPNYTPKALAKKPKPTIVLPRLGDLFGGVSELGRGITQRLGAALGFMLSTSPQRTPTVQEPQAANPVPDQSVWYVPADVEQQFTVPRTPAPIWPGHIRAEESDPLAHLVSELTTIPCGGCRAELSTEPKDLLVVGKDQKLYHGPCFTEFVGEEEKTDLGVNYQAAYTTLDLLVQSKVPFTSRADLLSALSTLPDTLQRYNLRAEFERRLSQVPRGTAKQEPRPTLKLKIPKKPGEQ